MSSDEQQQPENGIELTTIDSTRTSTDSQQHVITEHCPDDEDKNTNEPTIVDVDNTNSNLNEDGTAKPTAAELASAEADKKVMEEPKVTARTVFLLIEIIILCIAVMFIEMCVVPALPTIQEEYVSQASWIPWMLSAYNIVGAVWSPMSGKFSDLIGSKWMIVFNMCLYFLGQVGCALFKNIFGLIVSRACQGFGMSMFVLSFNVINTVLPAKLVPILTALIGSLFSVGMSVGLVGGAAIMEGIHWQYVFWITSPFIVVPTIGLIFTMPNDFSSTRRRFRLSQPAKVVNAPWYFKIDIVGCVLLAVGVVLLLMGLTFEDSDGWNATSITMIVVGLALMLTLCVYDFFFPNPLLPIRILLSRKMGLSAINTIIVGFLNFTVFQMDPYLLTSPIMDYKFTSMISVGLVLLPFGLSILAVAVPLTLASKPLGWSLLFTISSAVCLLFFSLLIPFHHTIAQAIILNIGIGVGLGGCNIIVQNIINAWCSKETVGSMTGAIMLLRVLGGAIGPVLINIFLHHNQAELFSGAYITPSESGYRNSFIFMACVSAGLLVVVFLPGQFQFLQLFKKKAAVTEESPKDVTEEKKMEQSNENAVVAEVTPNKETGTCTGASVGPETTPEPTVTPTQNV